MIQLLLVEGRRQPRFPLRRPERSMLRFPLRTAAPRAPIQRENWQRVQIN